MGSMTDLRPERTTPPERGPIAARLARTSRVLPFRVPFRWRPRPPRWLTPRRARRAGMALALLLLLCAGAFGWAWNTAPSTSSLETWVRAEVARHHSGYTPITSVPPVMTEALIAIEDERFYQNHGIDTIGLARAAWADLRAGRIVEGGSTITAQLAKNAYLHDYDHTVPLKLEDLLLALKIGHRYSKADVLEMYLNLVYFGQGAYGIGMASERYFGTAPAHLDAAQAALLAGLVRAPGYYDPWCHPQMARARQHAVLARMVTDGYLTPRQAATAAAQTFDFWRLGATPPRDAYCAS